MLFFCSADNYYGFYFRNDQWLIELYVYIFILLEKSSVNFRSRLSTDIVDIYNDQLFESFAIIRKNVYVLFFFWKLRQLCDEIVITRLD